MSRNFTQSRSFVTFNDLPNSLYYLQKYNLPGLTLDVTTQGTPYQKIPLPGSSINYNPFNCSFIIDEDMKVWYELWQWVKINNSASKVGDFSLYIYNNTSKKIVMRVDFTGGWVGQENDVMFHDDAQTDSSIPKIVDCWFNYVEYTPYLQSISLGDEIIGVE